MMDKPCTCSLEDNPPVPCARKYALTECREAQLWEQYETRRAFLVRCFAFASSVVLALILGFNAWLVYLIWFSR